MSRICKHFEITTTNFSNSERSEQCLVTECFVHGCFFDIINQNNQNSNCKQLLGLRKHAEKLENKQVPFSNALAFSQNIFAAIV